MENKYYEFKNEIEIENWIKENYNKFVTNIRKDSNKKDTLGNALFSYTGSMSASYNYFLQKNNGNIKNINKIIDDANYNYKYVNIDLPKLLDDKEKKQLYKIFDEEAIKDIPKIYEAFSLNEIQDDILLFHYFHINNLNEHDLKNNTFQLNQFISTTLIKKSKGIKKLMIKRKYDALLIIKTKKGTPCIPIANNPNSQLKEYEMILKPQTKFIITKKRKKFFSKIKYIFECEIN